MYLVVLILWGGAGAGGCCRGRGPALAQTSGLAAHAAGGLGPSTAAGRCGAAPGAVQLVVELAHLRRVTSEVVVPHFDGLVTRPGHSIQGLEHAQPHAKLARPLPRRWGTSAWPFRQSAWLWQCRRLGGPAPQCAGSERPRRGWHDHPPPPWRTPTLAPISSRAGNELPLLSKNTMRLCPWCGRSKHLDEPAAPSSTTPVTRVRVRAGLAAGVNAGPNNDVGMAKQRNKTRLLQNAACLQFAGVACCPMSLPARKIF